MKKMIGVTLKHQFKNKPKKLLLQNRYKESMKKTMKMIGASNQNHLKKIPVDTMTAIQEQKLYIKNQLRP